MRPDVPYGTISNSATRDPLFQRLGLSGPIRFRGGRARRGGFRRSLGRLRGLSWHPVRSLDPAQRLADEIYQPLGEIGQPVPGQRVQVLPPLTELVPASIGQRVLLAVMDEHAAGGRVTISDVERRTGLSRQVTHKFLRRLRRDGLVDWQDGTRGTLHPCVRRVL